MAKRQGNERVKKNAVLNRLEATRQELIRESKKVARRIARKQGVVTSTDVFASLRRGKFADKVDTVDPRFMGAVFRDGFTRVDFAPVGSHKRPVSVWALDNAS